MKKHLLGIVFVGATVSSVLAEECTKEQYSPIFSDTNRYMYSSSSFSGDTVIDTKSIVYNQKDQKIKAWTVTQMKKMEGLGGFFKIYWEFDLKKNEVRVLDDVVTNCDGRVNKEKGERDSNWRSIAPQSNNELTLDDLKSYLKIK